MGLEIMQANGWNTENEKLYNTLSVGDRIKLNKVLLLELECTIPFKRKSFKELYYLTLKEMPKLPIELIKDLKVSKMHVELLQKELDRVKVILKIKD